MPRNNKKDIYEGRIEYSSIAFLSKKLRVGIIGAGKGGVIKARHFLKQNSQVFTLNVSLRRTYPALHNLSIHLLSTFYWFPFSFISKFIVF